MIKKAFFLFFVLFVSVLVVMSSLAMEASPLWPDVDSRDYRDIVLKSQDEFRRLKLDPSKSFVQYSADGSYMRYEATYSYRESDRRKFDEEGLPIVKYGDSFQYNPVSIAQFALAQYGDALSGDESAKKLFLKASDFLIQMQDNGGALRYWFEWRYYLTKEVYAPGWISGMAQGQALSALSRAFFLTGNERYYRAAQNAFRFLITPKDKGGPMSTLADLHPSLNEFIFFEEYLSTPNNYTLNGYLFTLVGIYDYLQLLKRIGKNDNIVKWYFDKGIETLVHILPYYDLNGFTCYDLGHYFFKKKPHIGVRYHSIHIYLLHALATVTQEEVISRFANKWYEYTEYSSETMR